MFELHTQTFLWNQGESFSPNHPITKSFLISFIINPTNHLSTGQDRESSTYLPTKSKTLMSSHTYTNMLQMLPKKRMIPQENNMADSDASSVSSHVSQVSDVSTSNERKPKRQRTEEEKKHDRIMANRRSARESRERKRKIMENLEFTVQRLTDENKDLQKLNEKLQLQVETLLLLSDAKSREHGTSLFPGKEQVPSQSLYAHPSIDQFSNNAFLQGLHLAMSLNQSPILPPLMTQASMGMMSGSEIASFMPQKANHTLHHLYQV
uniref:BZIP domain-containing protein n=1 Tax=Ditylum brightwellii TaxID=49249 RepID=A0A6V2KEY2_9STRA